MSKKTGILFILAGLLLIGASLLLYLHNQREDQAAGETAQQVLQEMQAEVTPTPTVPPQLTPTPRPVKTAMTVTDIDGNGYIGYVGIPALELELPVMADWSYSKLRVAPCQHAGATFTDDLVIAAHNYDKHFGKLKDLSLGAEVTFTDMDGDFYRYTVAKLETVAPTAVEEVLESGYDLVLYTCTYGGKTRVVAFCEYADP